MASLDVVVHPGERDTFGQTIQEAMVDLLRDQVRRLAADADERAAFGTAGRALVRDRSWRTLTDLLVDHHVDLTATAGLPVAV